ncbi:MAG: glutaminase A [Myxococcota bacterium]
MADASDTPSSSNPVRGEAVDRRELNLFNALDTTTRGYVTRGELHDALVDSGLRSDDPRLPRILGRGLRASDPLDFESFCALVRPHIVLLEKALSAKFILPDFPKFAADVEHMFSESARNDSGQVATYIPQLSRVDPELHAVSVCSVDGQRLSLGDCDVPFCVQSCCKPINYCLALEEHGAERVHEHVGREPSGRGFNELTLNAKGRPHNPMINAGAIMCCSLIKPESAIADRFDHVMATWSALAGDKRPNFNNAVYLSERQTADRNFALGYFMRENGAFPEGTDLIKTLEFYFQCCSIEMTADTMAVVAATLANGGVSPISGRKILSAQTVQHCLSLMYSCGMYDFSGEFAFTIGLPAKSGVSGGMMVVVPNTLGFCTWSPRLDELGNSVRGIEFCQRLVDEYNFHNYDHIVEGSNKRDPRLTSNVSDVDQVVTFIWAAAKGDLGAIQRLAARGVDLDAADYDGRTALHLAAAEGQTAIVEFLVRHGADLNPTDRWGNTPLDDARRSGAERVLALLAPRGLN